MKQSNLYLYLRLALNFLGNPSMTSFCFNGHQLPSLFLVGAQKCGTTSLSAQLFREWGFRQGYQFKDGLFSDSKEHHFFDIEARWRRGLAYYATSFPPCGSATIDATPNYMFETDLAARLKEMYGEWRTGHSTFVFLLCDPVQRAQSAFCEPGVQHSNLTQRERPVLFPRSRSHQ